MVENPADYPSLIFLKKMTWPEVESAARETALVVVPIGSFEQHGPHLPFDVDTMTAEYLALESVQAASHTLGRRAAVIAPTIPFGGPGLGMVGWPGTINLRPQTLIELYKDVAVCLRRAGFRYILALTGCYGNVASLTLAGQTLKTEFPDTEFLLLEGLWADGETIARVRESPRGGTGHACEVETSVALAIAPESVHMERAVDELPKMPSDMVSFDFNCRSSYGWPIAFRQMTQSGVMGMPTLATVEKGKAILAAAVERVTKVLIEVNRLSGG